MRGLIFVFLTIAVISIFVVPIVINESYKVSSGYITLWDAKDLLSCAGTVISSIGAIFIGIIAFKQNDRANDINNRLLKLQEVNSTPFFQLDFSVCELNNFSDREIDMTVGLRNVTNSVINIKEVSQIKIGIQFQGQQLNIPFSKGWTNYYSVLPHQTKDINFFKEVKRDDVPLNRSCGI